jgi:hypothetical protein
MKNKTASIKNDRVLGTLQAGSSGFIGAQKRRPVINVMTGRFFLSRD